MRDPSIHNDVFLKRIFERKLRRGLVRMQVWLNRMSFKGKVQFVVDKLSEMRFNEARIILEHWENTSEIVDFLEKFQIKKYEIVRKYKMGHLTPGLINIYFFDDFDSAFLRIFIIKHFSYEAARPGAWNLWPLLAIDTTSQIIAIKLFSNREFQEYIYLKK